MPYIKPEYREKVDGLINHFVREFQEDCKDAGFDRTKNGTANYIVTRIILGILKPPLGWTYETLSDVVKTLECSKMEIYDRLLRPYEDNKIRENGDVKEFKDGESEILGASYLV